MADFSAIAKGLRPLVGGDSVMEGSLPGYSYDATESRKIKGRADAIVLPETTEEVAAVARWCYDHDVPMVPRGGGTGFTGGAVAVDGGVLIALDRMQAVRALDPGLWRISVEAGLRTSHLRRRARENGLLFPPDPGAAEQSQIGGNIATNAGGPHAFKYGVTGAWVTGVEAVCAPGEVVSFGGAIRKDVAGYDLRSLLIGSEGTLGIITAAWLKLIPAPETSLPLVAFYADAASGCAALEGVLASGLMPAALEYLDAATLEATRGTFPREIPADAAFMVIAEADGSVEEAERLRLALIEVLDEAAVDSFAPQGLREIDDLWRWRDGASIAVTAKRGGKVSEDIAVPMDRLLEAIEGTIEIGRRHDIPACSWGHAGDGNLHSTFMIDLEAPDELARAEEAAEDLFSLAAELGGSVSGEHGIGLVKGGALDKQWSPAAVSMHEAIKQALDPKNLFNPGKKLARIPA